MAELMHRYIDPATYGATYGASALDVPPIPTLAALVMGVLDYPPEADPKTAMRTPKAAYEAGARLRLQVRRELVPYAISFHESPEYMSAKEAQLRAYHQMRASLNYSDPSAALAGTGGLWASPYSLPPNVPVEEARPEYTAHHDTLCGFGGLVTEEWFSRADYSPDGVHVTRHMESGIERSGSASFLEMCRWAFKRVSHRIENVRAQRARQQERPVP